MTKTIVVDNNIVQEHGQQKQISKIKNSNIIKSIKSKKIILYASDSLLQQRLGMLYDNKKEKEYNIVLDFINNYCDEWIINSTVNIMTAELKIIKELLKDVNVPLRINRNLPGFDLVYNSPHNIFKEYDANKFNERKKEVINQFKASVKTILEQIKHLNTNEQWNAYINSFIEKNNCAERILYDFVEKNQDDNLTKFKKLFSLFWRYASLKQLLEFFDVKNAEKTAIEIIDNSNPLPYESHFGTNLRIYEFLDKYYFQEGRHIDPDTPMDMSYIEIMTNYDILLTEDKGFMKECFEYVHPNKKIMDLKTFLKIYG